MSTMDKTKKKPINHGKRFEDDFKKSIPVNVYCQRLKDDAMGFKGIKNECDYIIFNNSTLYLLELKTTGNTTSIPIGNITDYQLDTLIMRDDMDGIEAGFLINFRNVDDNPTYYISAKDLKNFLEKTNKKSIPLEYLRKNCIKCFSSKKRVRYTYDVADLLLDIKNKK